ncbi:hypothetical protein HK097_007972 [Rhizophlyctis rosea]|uniref:Uncharacterized protein n=1 Tax=Rhizophlyctis rosea TaxID=64517 RepID=A0AAD5SJL9_9FUNG|nr:hypothetical protein HK097_007972 [Rhizophlyctis rosea]
MKFAKQYSNAYQDLPPEWPVIEYKALKKSIKKIVKELEETGILVNAPEGESDNVGSSSSGSSPSPRYCTVDYFLDNSGDKVEPYIVIKLEEEEPEAELEEDVLGEAADIGEANDSVLISTTADEGGDDWKDADGEEAKAGDAKETARESSISPRGTPKTGPFRRSSPTLNGASPHFSPQFRKLGTPKLSPKTSPRGSPRASPKASPRVFIRVSSMSAIDPEQLPGGLTFDPLPSSVIDPTAPVPEGKRGSFTHRDSPTSPTTSHHPLRFTIVRSSSPEPAHITELTDDNASETSSVHSGKNPPRMDSDETADSSLASPSSPEDGDQLSRSPSSAGTRKLLVNRKALGKKKKLNFTVATGADDNEVKLNLRMDHQFFQELAESVNTVTKFEAEMKAIFEKKMETLAEFLTDAASPYGKDMYAWRKILAEYLESDIWLVDGTKDRPVVGAKNQLQLFGERVTKQHMDTELKLQSSRQALEHFWDVNRELLRVKQFDEINHTAVYKILKKHDKRTLLTASSSFPLLSTDTFFTHNLARLLVFTVCERLQTVVPQPDDYACPICQDVTWKPIQLVCHHVFCVRCLVKAQLRKVKNCPVCRRENAVADASADNLDTARMNFLKLYFPKEVKQKIEDSSKERAKEDTAALMKSTGGDCVVM